MITRLLPLAVDPDDTVRHLSIGLLQCTSPPLLRECLGSMSPPETLVRAAHEDDVPLRAASTVASSLSGPSGVPHVREQLQHPDKRVRQLAIAVLPFCTPCPLEELFDAIDDKDRNIRITAVRSVGMLGRPAVHRLRRLLSDEDAYVRYMVSAYLAAEDDPPGTPPTG
jgi:HEAT repeat protein